MIDAAAILVATGIAMRIGLISDTHGLLRPEAVAFLRGCDHIIHGGDIGGPGILEALARIAPLTAVRGNNDTDAWATTLQETERMTFGHAHVFVVHDIAQLDIDPPAAGVQVIVSGHSHRPQIRHRDAVVYINPGSAGPRRFRLPIAIGELVIAHGQITPRIVELELR
jgi:uncharacterized protein